MKKLRTFLLAALIVAGMIVWTCQANAVAVVAAHAAVVTAHPVVVAAHPVVAHPVEAVTARSVTTPRVAEPVTVPHAALTPIVTPSHHCDKSKEKCQ